MFWFHGCKSEAYSRSKHQEVILPIHQVKVYSKIIITAVMWTRTKNLTNYASKNPLQVASGPHPLRRAWSLSRKLVEAGTGRQWVSDKGRHWSDSSLLNGSEVVSYSVSQWVTDKHSQWFQGYESGAFSRSKHQEVILPIYQVKVYSIFILTHQEYN